MLRPVECALCTAYEAVHIVAVRMQLDEILQVLALAAAVVVQPPHVSWGQPGCVDHREPECKPLSRLATCAVDVGDVDDTAGVLQQQLHVVLPQFLGLTAQPHRLIAHAQAVHSIAAA